jgi:hypothetical protein
MALKTDSREELEETAVEKGVSSTKVKGAAGLRNREPGEQDLIPVFHFRTKSVIDTAENYMSTVKIRVSKI